MTSNASQPLERCLMAFPKFKKLPPELRANIWTLAASPRDVELLPQHAVPIPRRKHNSLWAYFQRSKQGDGAYLEVRRSNLHAAALWVTSRESRGELRRLGHRAIKMPSWNGFGERELVHHQFLRTTHGATPASALRVGSFSIISNCRTEIGG